jgi:putative copper export protein
MTLGALIILQFLHVLFAIAWFGASLAIVFLVVPSARRLPAETQVAWWHAFAANSKVIFPALAGLTIVLGIARGIVGGVLGNLGTAYGITWIAALLFGIALAAWGARMTGPNAERLAEAAPAEVEGRTAQMLRIGSIELAGFGVIFAMMIAMRFGY